MLFADVVKTKSNGTISSGTFVNEYQNSTDVLYEDEKLRVSKVPDRLKEEDGNDSSTEQNFSAHSMDAEHENLESAKPSGSAIWEYFTVRDESSAVCNACQKEVRGPWKQSTSNFIRHLTQRHTTLHAELTESKKFHKKNRYEYHGSHPGNEDHEGADPTGSAMWRCFTVVDGNSATCNTCKRELHGPWRQSTANYMRHLKNQHNLLFAELMGVKSDDSGDTDTPMNQEKKPTNMADADETVGVQPPVKDEVHTADEITSSSAVCKVEKKEELVDESDPLSDNEPTSEDFPKSEFTEGVKEGGSKILWKYFTRKDDNSATCNTCDKEIRGPIRSSSSNYKRHLMRRHKPQYAELMESKVGLKKRLHQLKASDALKSLKESLLPKEEEGFVESQNSIPGTTNATTTATRTKSVLLDYFARKDKDTFTCNSCGNDFKAVKGTKGNLAKHLLRNHEEKYAEYKSKRLQMLQVSGLKKYMSLASQKFSNEWYKCDPCKTSFGDEVKWARHMQRHKGEPG